MLLVQIGINSARDVWKLAFQIQISAFIISMTKLLDADWLRGLQLFH